MFQHTRNEISKMSRGYLDLCFSKIMVEVFGKAHWDTGKKKRGYTMHRQGLAGTVSNGRDFKHLYAALQ